jgi:hypothetical protein
LKNLKFELLHGQNFYPTVLAKSSYRQRAIADKLESINLDKTIAQNWLVTVATTQMIDNLSVSNNHNLSRQRKIKMNLKEKIFIENL